MDEGVPGRHDGLEHAWTKQRGQIRPGSLQARQADPVEGCDVRGRDEAGMRGDLRSDARPARVRPGHVHRAVLRQERRQRHAVQEQRREVGGHSPARLHDRGRLLRREGSGGLDVAEIRPRAEVVRPEPMDPMRHAPHVTAADQSLRNPGRAQVATGERPAGLDDVRQGQGRRGHARDDGSTRPSPARSGAPTVDDDAGGATCAGVVRGPGPPGVHTPGARRFPHENAPASAVSRTKTWVGVRGGRRARPARRRPGRASASGPWRRRGWGRG